MTREEILMNATKCVCGQRERDYGKPEDNIGLISKLWSEYTGQYISTVDVSMMMCMLKIARIKNGTMTEDSFVDLCGYGAIGGEIASQESSKGKINIFQRNAEEIFKSDKIEGDL